MSETKNYLIVLSIGPVQGFIAAARKTRDLWFGSHLLSEISKAAAKSIADNGGKLVFPGVETVDELEPNSSLSVANVVLAKVAGDPKTIAEQAKQAAVGQWKKFAEQAKRKVEEIAKGHQVLREKHFQDKEDVRIWIAMNQAGRRNLTGFQRAEAALKLKNVIAAQAKKNQKASGGPVSQKSDKPVHTDKILAKMAGMSHATLRQVEYILAHAGDERKAALRQGKESINKVYGELKANEKAASESADGSKPDQQDGKKGQAPAPAKKSKERQPLKKQIEAHLKRIDGLEKDFPRKETRDKIIDQVSQWLEKKKADASAQQE